MFYTNHNHMRQYHLKMFAALSKMLLCHFHRNIIMIKWINWMEEQCMFECIRTLESFVAFI